MRGHTGHDHRFTGALAALCERDVEQPVRLARIVKEDFVKVTHAIKDKGLRELGFDAQVLLHHGRVGGLRRRQHGGNWVVVFVLIHGNIVNGLEKSKANVAAFPAAVFAF